MVINAKEKIKQKTRSRLGSGLGYNVKKFVQRGLTETATFEQKPQENEEGSCGDLGKGISG